MYKINITRGNSKSKHFSYYIVGVLCSFRIWFFIHSEKLSLYKIRVSIYNKFNKMNMFLKLTFDILINHKIMVCSLDSKYWWRIDGLLPIILVIYVVYWHPIFPGPELYNLAERSPAYVWYCLLGCLEWRDVCLVN